MLTLIMQCFIIIMNVISTLPQGFQMCCNSSHSEQLLLCTEWLVESMLDI